MHELVEGLGSAERERVATLLREDRFFWADLSLADANDQELAGVFGITPPALHRLVDFGSDPPSRKFYADGQRVVFSFTCFVEPGERLQAIEVHVLVTGGYVLTLHQERVSLRQLLTLEMPEGRGEQYFVYVILDAMVGTGFDVLNEAELTLETLQLQTSDMHAARVRLQTLRGLSSRLSALRRRIAPQRGICERIGEEIRRVEGLAPDSERYFERICEQLNRLTDAIDAAAEALAQLIDLRLNETIYWLTVVATIFLPLTFLTGFFGMNFGWLVDHIDTPLAFVLLGIGGPVAAVVATVWLVRRRGTPIEPEQRARPRPARPGG